MELNILKENLKSKTLTDDFFIFLVDEKDNLFLTNQYVQEISKILGNKEIEYIDSLEHVLNPYNNLFDVPKDTLKVYKCPLFDVIDTRLNFTHNLIIIANKISDEAKSTYSYNIINMPKLENWMIRDYAITYGSGIEENDIDYLCNVCNYDIYRIANELDKMNGFGIGQRKYFFKQMKEEGAFDDLTSYNMFNLTNAIQAKDILAISNILKSNMEIDAIALISLLYQGFRKMIMVFLDKNPTPESTGLKSNQIWAIRNIPRNYTKEQLIQIFKFLSSLDIALKQGNLPNDNNQLSEYIIMKILSY